MKTIARCTIAASLTLFAGLAAALTTDGDGTVCDPEVSECVPTTPPGPPPQPTLPTAVSGYGLWRLVSPIADNIEGGLNGIHQTYIFGGGPGSYYNGGLVTQSDGPAASLSFQVQTSPIAAVSLSATGNALGGAFDTGHASVSMSLSYRVVLRADDAAAAQAIENLLATSGSVATLDGSYSLAGHDYGYGSVAASTGTRELGAGLARNFNEACGGYGVQTTIATAGCGSGRFHLDVNFVDGGTYRDGNSLDFVSLVGLSADVQTGYNDYDGSIDPGFMTAFIDPTITLANGIRGQLILGDNGNVSNAGGVSPVPEPSQAALLLAGMGLWSLWGLSGVSGLLRRQRGKAAVAA